MEIKQMAREVRLRYWAEVMRERHDSGKNIRSWCLENGITEKTYYYWQRKLKEAASEQFKEFKTSQQNTYSFTEIKLPEVAAPKLIPDSGESSHLVIEIGEIRLSAGSSYPPNQLASLLRELIVI